MARNVSLLMYTQRDLPSYPPADVSPFLSGAERASSIKTLRHDTLHSGEMTGRVSFSGEINVGAATEFARVRQRFHRYD